MTTTVEDTERKVASFAPLFKRGRDEMAKVLVGQHYLVDRLLIGLLADGHVLVEGVPGLAKTTAIKALANTLHLQFSRIQFTPDLLPADLVGTQIYNPREGNFSTRLGPIVANVVLADEINRAPAKVQSALLEAMQERQVTIGDLTHKLPKPFLVLATQNPIEQEGTYALPEAQVDRFMLKLNVTYPKLEEELLVIERSALPTPQVSAVMTAEEVLGARDVVQLIKIADPLMRYIVALVRSTREPGLLDKSLARAIQYGASPRAGISLAAAARGHAFLDGRGFTLPEDVRAIAPDVLRHRVLPTYEAEADGITPDELVKRLLDKVPMP